MELIHATFTSNTTTDPLEELAKATSRWIASTDEGEKFQCEQGGSVDIRDILSAHKEECLNGFGITDLEINRLPFKVYRIYPESSRLDDAPLETATIG